MTPYDVCMVYLSMKQHFTKPSYSFQKYKGKVNLSAHAYEARKDKYFFQKLAKHRDPINFLLSNILINPNLWIRDIAYTKAGEENYSTWLKTQQSLLYRFKEDLTKLQENYKSNFVVQDNEHPPIIVSYLRGDISLETLAILVDITRCSPYWKRHILYDPVFDELIMKVEKYIPFLQYDQVKFKEAISTATKYPVSN